MSDSVFRLFKAMRQYASQNGIHEAKLTQVMMQMQSLMLITGEYTLARQMLTRLGRHLFRDEAAVLVPICHAWDELSGFGNTLPPVVQAHIEFLEMVCKIAPQLKPVFLIPDTEAFDDLLLRSTKRSAGEFLGALQREQAMVQSAVRLSGWKAAMMTNHIADLAERESRARKELHDSDKHHGRLATLTLERSRLYSQMGISDPVERELRTVQVAAQYIALGSYAEEKEAIIATHTTTNVMWYRDCGAAMLHNPRV